MAFKRITLCADDYSFTPAISEAIINLVSHNRLSAISCMTNTKHWETHAKWLLPYREKMDIGLHLTFTDVPPILGTHPRLMLKAYTRQLNAAVIKKEIKHQIEQFQNAMGQAPHFIDGHQHVHQLPVIRQALVDVYHAIFPENNCYIRVPSEGLLTIKSSLIALTGASRLKKLLVRHGIPHNTSFSGIYSFQHANHYAQYFPQFLKAVKTGGLIMCHPGFATASSIDSIALQRNHEYNYLNSMQFIQDCQENQAQLSRFHQPLEN